MRGTDGPDERRTLEDNTAARLAEIVAAAETAAKNVIDDAEAEAQRQLSDADAESSRLVAERIARVAAVADRLADQAAAIKRQSEELIAELQRAKEELGVGSDPFEPDPVVQPRVVGSADDAAQRKSHLTALTFHDGGETPEPTAPVAAAADQEDPRTPAGARLLATQMAVSGSSREEIEQRLRNGFEIEDTAPILDAILGPEG
jgi:hypothetical protein